MNSPLLGSFLPWVVLFVVLLGDRSGNVYSKALQADEGVHVRLELMWTVGCPELQAADGIGTGSAKRVHDLSDGSELVSNKINKLF